jgi:hypothetical protein
MCDILCLSTMCTSTKLKDSVLYVINYNPLKLVTLCVKYRLAFCTFPKVVSCTLDNDRVHAVLVSVSGRMQLHGQNPNWALSKLWSSNLGTLKPNPEPIREPACSGEPPNIHICTFEKLWQVYSSKWYLLWILIKKFAFEHY